MNLSTHKKNKPGITNFIFSKILLKIPQNKSYNKVIFENYLKLKDILRK